MAYTCEEKQIGYLASYNGYVTLNTNGGGGASNSVEPMEVDLATGSGLVPQYYLEVTITTSAEQLVYKYQGAGGYVSSETCADIKKFRDTYATNPAQILAIAGKLAEKAGKINPVGLVPSRSVEQLEVTTRGMSFQYSKTMENSSLQLDKIDSFLADHATTTSEIIEMIGRLADKAEENKSY